MYSRTASPQNFRAEYLVGGGGGARVGRVFEKKGPLGFGMRLINRRGNVWQI
jgi:hypothetical protein